MKTTISKILKLMQYTGRTQKLTSRETKAGIVAKLYQNKLSHDGYWFCLADAGLMNSDLYQRTIDLKHARDIADSYKSRLARPALCSLRDDSPLPAYKDKLTLFKDDGQHIIEAMMMKGEFYEINNRRIIPCLVNFDMTFAEASETFFHNNNGTSRKKVQNWVAFNAAYLGQSSHHVEIIQLAHEHGLTTPLDDIKDDKPRDLTHADRYLRIRRNKSLDMLDTLFALHANCWKGQSHGVTFLRAMETVIETFNLKADVATINALQSPTLIAELEKRAKEISIDMCCKPHEPTWRTAICERLYAAKVIPAVIPMKPKATAKPAARAA